jgi:hypothetical protein
VSVREDILKTATSLLAARLPEGVHVGAATRKELVTEAVGLAEELVTEVDRRYPREDYKRGGPDDR